MIVNAASISFSVLVTEKSLIFSALIFWSISESSAYSACNLALSVSGLRDSAIASVVSLFSASTPVIVSPVIASDVSVSTGSNAAFSAAALISDYFYWDLVFFTVIIITIVMIIIIINNTIPIAKEVLLAGFIFSYRKSIF